MFSIPPSGASQTSNSAVSVSRDSLQNNQTAIVQSASMQSFARVSQQPEVMVTTWADQYGSLTKNELLERLFKLHFTEGTLEDWNSRSVDLLKDLANAVEVKGGSPEMLLLCEILRTCCFDSEEAISWKVLTKICVSLQSRNISLAKTTVSENTLTKKLQDAYSDLLYTTYDLEWEIPFLENIDCYFQGRQAYLFYEWINQDIDIFKKYMYSIHILYFEMVAKGEKSEKRALHVLTNIANYYRNQWNNKTDKSNLFSYTEDLLSRAAQQVINNKIQIPSTSVVMPISKKQPITNPSGFNSKNHEYDRSVVRQFYKEPQLWYPSKRLSFEVLCELLWDSTKPLKIEELKKALKQIRIDPPFLSAYQIIIYLFYLQVYLEEKQEIALAKKVGEIINERLIAQISTFERKQLVRYASLIHTDKPEQADAFRAQIQKAFLLVIDNSGGQWRSTQATIEAIQEFCDNLSNNPDRILNVPQLQTLQFKNNEGIKSLALQLKKRCEYWLFQLSKGEEVQLPAFYHGIATQHMLHKFVPKKMLTQKVVAQNASSVAIFSGAFVSTAIEDGLQGAAYFGPGLAFPLYAMFRDEFDVHNFFCPINNNNKAQRRNDRWLGFHHGIPIAPEDGSFLTGHQLSAVIALDDAIEHQCKALPEALANVSVMGKSEAKLLEYILRVIAPVLTPNYQERSLQLKQLESAVSQINSSDRLSLSSTRFRYAFKNEYLGRDEGIYFTNKIVNMAFERKNIPVPCSLMEFLLLLTDDPRRAQELSCDGYFTITADQHDLRIERNKGSEELMRVLLETRKNRLENIKIAFPHIKQYRIQALHHVWDWSEDSAFGTVVGYNPYLIINFRSIQAYLRRIALIEKENLTKIEGLADIMEKIAEGDEFARRILMTSMALRIAVSAETYSFGSIPLGIFLTMELNNQKYSIFLDHDSFDIMELHGRDERHIPNDPWLASMLYQNLSNPEKAHLLLCIQQKAQPGSVRVQLVMELLEEMGKAIEKRYFIDSALRGALPRHISNTSLVQILQNVPNSQPVALSASCLPPLVIEKRAKRLIGLRHVYGDYKSARKSECFTHRIHELLSCSISHDRFLWHDSILLIQKAEKLTFNVVYEGYLPPSAFNILLLGCMMIIRNKQMDPIAKQEHEKLEQLCRFMLPLLISLEEASLRRALTLIDGDIGRQLRHILYPMLYKDSKGHTCYENSVGELLAEGKVIAERALQGDLATYSAQYDLSHLSLESQRVIWQEWLDFIIERQQKLAQGIPVSLSHWNVSTIDTLGNFVLHSTIKLDSEASIIGIPNVLEAERYFFETKENKSFSAKYLLLNKLPYNSLNFFVKGENTSDLEEVERYVEGDVSRICHLRRETAFLEERFLEGRKPDMISTSWKHVESTPCKNYSQNHQHFPLKNH